MEDRNTGHDIAKTMYIRWIPTEFTLKDDLKIETPFLETPVRYTFHSSLCRPLLAPMMNINTFISHGTRKSTRYGKASESLLNYQFCASDTDNDIQ